jgi:hypothetical protein
MLCEFGPTHFTCSVVKHPTNCRRPLTVRLEFSCRRKKENGRLVTNANATLLAVTSLFRRAGQSEVEESISELVSGTGKRRQ